MNTTLYNITDEYKVLISKLEESGGEVTPEVESALALTQEKFAEKAAGYGYVIKSFDDEAELAEKEIMRLKAIKEAAEKKSEWLRSKISEAMQQFDVKEVKLNNIKLSLRKSESVLIEDESKLPEEFKRTIPEKKEPDKNKIKNCIKQGETIPGASLITKENLQVK